MPTELGPSSFRPRQTSYLRIGPGQVLQMVLYLEPHDVSWMSTDLLERVLVALRDRIPEKLGKESMSGKKGKAKEKVDVFRGADFQFAFYFRTTGQKHAVLLKDRQLLMASPKSSAVRTEPANAKKRPRAASPEAQVPLDLTTDDDVATEAGTSGERPSKRLDPGPLFAVKDEEVDESLPAWGAPPVPDEQEEEKPDAGMDEKPTLKVNYTGYSIFSRSLVVIVEPYPRLAQKARGAFPSDAPAAEVHQLSASAPPEAFRRSFSRASSSSATPAPTRRRVAQQPLFRNSTTPMEEDEEEEEEVDDNMRSLRERSQALANEDSVEEEEEEELPTVEELTSK